ncbi:hypothetical protein [Streptomyces sp. NBC_00878]|uniref:hypothetical protein n=1 Tax=Streptomyces sp. NBC_00878 TaxID=2975854 RepID=UPI0022533AEE|nr:hypothetical protein [Streptomyces sp. NBC_00878]MCX4911882.1 hypothetical protein [Streptomyces sp. NBC_00878]
MTTTTRKAAATTTPAKAPAKTAAKKPPAKKPATRTPRKPAAKKTTPPSLSLVKALPTQPQTDRRTRDFVTDAQIYATHHARLAGIPIHRIRDWRDHRNNTATRPLTDGTLLHYDHTTRTLTWQGTCAMGATHAFKLTSPSTATAARVEAARCEQLHADLTTIEPLTKKELAGLGILHTPTWARPDLLGEDITQTIPVPLPNQRPRALGDELTHSDNSTTDTQPLSRDDIAEGLAQRATDTAKEHPDHA